jgi:hypothetical protein
VSDTWVTVSALATGVGTLVLATATFASVRSAQRAARVAERSLLAGLRPLLVPSRPEDPSQSVGFVDDEVLVVPGAGAAAHATGGAVYLALALRNVGSGIAVLDRWDLVPERITGADARPADVSTFRRLTRDLYLPPGEIGFWQGAFRDPDEPGFAAIAAAVVQRRWLTLDLLYADYEGGQRTISRFALSPTADGGWDAIVGRHFNVDRADPR